MVFADLALYEAKEKGRDNYHFFTRELKERVEKSRRIEQELRVALDQGQLELFYQPQVRVSDGAVTGVEALLRWRHPERGLLLPGMFLSVAEQTNLAVPIGRFVVETAARTARQWLDAGVRFGKLALNVSPRHLDQESFTGEFLAALGRYGVEPSRIGVEVVESVLIDDARRRHAEVLRELHAAGVWIELDDFGTGYASLTHVTSLQVDVIKLDRSFARDLLGNPRMLSVVEAMIGLGRRLRLDVICEGIETQAQLNKLRSLGDVSVQGYYIARPMDAAAMLQWLQANGAKHESSGIRSSAA